MPSETQSQTSNAMRWAGRIVSAMINIGKSLKQLVIAEGVETCAQLNFLRRHGCGGGQGFYFSRPVPAEQAGKLLKADIREAVVHSRWLAANIHTSTSE
jgi:EAL domain-containing protein (putative c-di-GMP-specific phosphodiesterase class I)